MKRLLVYLFILSVFLVNAQTNNLPAILSVTPNSGIQGESLSLVISGQNMNYEQWSGTMLMLSGVRFTQWSGTTSPFTGTSTSSNSDELFVDVTIPVNQDLGLYDLEVWDYDTDDWVYLNDAFTVHILEGCTDPSASNYDPNANVDDGSCCYNSLFTLTLYDSYGDGWNGNSITINGNDYSIADINGDYNTTNVFTWYPDGDDVSFSLCLDLSQCIDIIYNPIGNYQSENTWEITDVNNLVVNSGTGNSAGSISSIGNCLGCTDPSASNYDPNANVDDGSCLYPGCTDQSASNYDPFANVDDGSCIPSACNGDPITGLFVSDIIDDRCVLHFDNMNTYDANSNQICRVDQIRIKYRPVSVLGTNPWGQKNIASPVGYNNGICNSTQKTEKNLYGLTLDTEYEWEVKVWYCTGQTTGWVQGPNFITAPECPNVRNTNAYGVNPTKARFTWDASNGVYDFLRIKIRLNSIQNPTSSDFIQVGGAGIPYGTYQKDKNGLTPGETYRGQGRTWCDPNGGAYNSLGWTFFGIWTQPTNRIDVGESIKNLDIFPNPSRDVFNITFISESVQDLRVVIRNVIGEELIIEDLQQFVGEYTKQINLKDNVKGVYLLEIKTHKGVINKKLILQ